MAVDGRVGVQLFQWTWSAIAAECPALAAQGFGFVQTSPVVESIRGPQWWTSYQPVSDSLHSKLGTPDTFSAMIEACHRAGVSVLVDAVINHMAAGDGVGVAGSPYRHYEYPGLWTSADFHHCGLTPDDDIANYQDAAQVQTCELVNLADLDTSRPNVRQRLHQFLADLVGLGVDGFRIDAAKHIAPTDLQAILAGLPAGTAVFSEVIRGGGEPITPEQYTSFGRVYEFAYSRKLAQALSLTIAGNIVTAGTGALPSAQAVSFVENHDTERNGQSVTRADAALHRLAEIVLLADDYGLPELFSGYAFSDRDAGPPEGPDGSVADAVCGTAPWTCSHRLTHVTAMLRYRATVAGTPVSRSAIGDLVVLARRDRGLAVVNVSAAAVQGAVPTALAPGRYCNVLATSCTGAAVVEVAHGQAAVSAGGHEAVVLDVDHVAG